MTKYIVQGGSPLFGEVHISGAKNAAVAILPAALLVDGVCRIENIPQISDVTVLLKILEQLGAKVRVLNRSDVELDCRHIVTTRAPQELAHKLRASYYLIGALLGRFGEAEVSMPGGCNFGGTRPIDQHVKGFAAMGATVREGDYICAAAEGGRMRGANIYLDVVSVGATMNIMMAAALADGTTVIENAAKEPHIVDLANFLNSMGADVKGAGTDTIRVAGVERLHGGAYAIIPDQIEAGTYMAAVAATGGQIRVRGIIPKHMDCITAKLQEMGVEVEEQDDDLIVRRSCATPTSKRCPTPASRRICSRRSPPCSRWRAAPAPSPRACGTAATATSASSRAWARRSASRAAPPSSRAWKSSPLPTFKPTTCAREPLCSSPRSLRTA